MRMSATSIGHRTLDVLHRAPNHAIGRLARDATDAVAADTESTLKLAGVET